MNSRNRESPALADAAIFSAHLHDRQIRSDTFAKAKTEENTVQREDILEKPFKLLETQVIRYYAGNGGGARKSSTDTLQRFWPDKEAILYDALRYYLSQQVDIWRRCASS